MTGDAHTRDGKEMDAVVSEDEVWRWLLGRVRGPGDAGELPPASPGPAGRWLMDVYRPLVADVPERFVVAHLGQSLDGRIACGNGQSRWVTGPEDVRHNHRMRALFDAVLVGASTIEYDDPRLTVREVEGANPVRVVLDQTRRLGSEYGVFQDGAAPTIVIADAAQAGRAPAPGDARVVGVPCEGGRLEPRSVLDRLADLGLCRVFVEGGGVTVSRFLAAGCLDRLQLTVAPLILGSGRPSLSLPEIAEVEEGRRPAVRRIGLGQDVMFEACFDA